MIALLAIITALLSPDVLSLFQAQASVAGGIELCHGKMPMPMPMAAGLDAAEVAGQDRSAHDGMQTGHACCKVCVCHPGASALPSAHYAAMLLPLAPGKSTAPAMVYAAPAIFSTKSSPRGPPAPV